MSAEQGAYVAAEQRCMFGTADAFCGERAALHVLQADGSPTMGCTEHGDWWTYHQHRDHHALAGDCGMPGTYWMFSAPDTSGFCFTDEQPSEPDRPSASDDLRSRLDPTGSTLDRPSASDDSGARS